MTSTLTSALSSSAACKSFGDGAGGGYDRDVIAWALDVGEPDWHQPLFLWHLLRAPGRVDGSRSQALAHYFEWLS